METESEFNAAKIAENMVFARQTSASGRFKIMPDNGVVWTVNINGWTAFESEDKQLVELIVAQIRQQLTDCLYTIYCRGGSEATTQMLSSWNERKTKALEAIADAQTVLAQKALVGSSVDPGTAAERVRERASQKKE